MENNPSNTQIRGPAAAAADVETLTPDVLAQKLLENLVNMESLVPDLATRDARDVKRVAARAKFAHELILPTISTVTNDQEFSGRKLFDTDRGRLSLQYRDELKPIVRRMAAFIAALDFTIDSKLADAGGEALQTYEWAKRASVLPGGGSLQPYVEEMTRVIKKTINHRPKPSAPATPPTNGAPVIQATPVVAGKEETNKSAE